MKGKPLTREEINRNKLDKILLKFENQIKVQEETREAKELSREVSNLFYGK